jgi:hypothetical protein
VVNTKLSKWIKYAGTKFSIMIRWADKVERSTYWNRDAIASVRPVGVAGVQGGHHLVSL